MSFYQFTKNENKSIIWGLLHEGGVFKDLPNSQIDNVKKQFETTILSMKPEFDLFFDKNDEGDDDCNDNGKSQHGHSGHPPHY